MRRKFIRGILIFILGAATTQVAQAQTQNRLDAPHSWSLGTNIGLSDLWGNVGTKSILDHYDNGSYFNTIHAMGGLFARYSFVPAFALKLSVNYGTLYASDAWNYKAAQNATSTSDDAYQRYARFQDIKDHVWEGALTMEFTPRRLNLLFDGSKKSAQVYFTGGVGYFHYTPYSSLNGKFYKIYNLHLEGDGLPVAGFPKRYSLDNVCIPLGIGYRFDIGQHLNLGVEYNYRITFTGYLDGVSNKYIDPKYFTQYLNPSDAALATALADKSKLAVGPEGGNAPGNFRGNPSFKDSYSTISIVFYYKVKSHGIPWWGY